LGRKKKHKTHSEPDYFARITGILGLILAIVAIIVPVWQDSVNEQERLSVWMRPNSGGIVMIPDDRTRSSVVQVPWLFTLSNTGKVKLSITGYDVFQVKNGGLSRFPNMVGFIRNPDDSLVVPPITLDAGESKTIKMHLGFRAKENVLDKLFLLNKNSGAFTLEKSLHVLAKDSLTLYGGQASYKNIEGSTFITIDPEFNKIEPVYRVKFVTGRGERFYVQGSETVSRFGS
jgi:hypothetical protein